jgi:hypothetical protein
MLDVASLAGFFSMPETDAGETPSSEASADVVTPGPSSSKR